MARRPKHAISRADLKGMEKSFQALRRGVRRRVMRQALQAGGGVYKTALGAKSWPRRFGFLGQRSGWIVKTFGPQAVGVGQKFRDISVGRAALKKATKTGRRLGKTRRVTARNESATAGGRMKVNPGRYFHLVEKGTAKGGRRRGPTKGVNLMAAVSRQKRAAAERRVSDKLSTGIDREARKAYEKSKGPNR